LDLSTTEETLLVEMRSCCIKICIVLVLQFYPWITSSPSGLQISEGLYSSVAKYFCTCLK
jgi:hypothetical protein